MSQTAAQAAWYQANRERILARKSGRKERNAELQREYRARHPERAKAAVRTSRAKKIEEYREKERARYIRISDKNIPAKCGSLARYRAGCRCEECRYFVKIQRHRRNNGYRPSKEQIQSRIDYYGRKCWMCGDPFECIDHVVAVNRGGTNHPANLRPACTSCNASKKDKPWLVIVKNGVK